MTDYSAAINGETMDQIFAEAERGMGQAAWIALAAQMKRKFPLPINGLAYRVMMTSIWSALRVPTDRATRAALDTGVQVPLGDGEWWLLSDEA